MPSVSTTSVTYLLFYTSIFCSGSRYRWAFVPEVNVNHYSGPETALIEGEQDCVPHVVRTLEGIQQRYGVCCKLGKFTFLKQLTNKVNEETDKINNNFASICNDAVYT